MTSDIQGTDIFCDAVRPVRMGAVALLHGGSERVHGHVAVAGDAGSVHLWLRTKLVLDG